MTDQEFIDQQWDEHGDYTEPGNQRRHFEQALQAALAYAREQASQGQWIPISERLPDDGIDVLTAIKYEKQPTMAHYNVLHKCWFESVEHSEVLGDAWLDNEIRASEVTHWMPTPPLPQGKEVDNA